MLHGCQSSVSYDERYLRSPMSSSSSTSAASSSWHHEGMPSSHRDGIPPMQQHHSHSEWPPHAANNWEMQVLMNTLRSNDGPSIPPSFGMHPYMNFNPSSSSSSNSSAAYLHNPPHSHVHSSHPLQSPAYSASSLPPSHSSSNFNVSPSPPLPRGSMEAISNPFFHFIKEDAELDAGRDKPVTEKQKSRRRASQNMASRNYRQRKKEYISSMEDKLEQLSIENERLRREVNETRHLSSKLLHENTELKNTPSCETDDETLNEELMNTELDLKHLIDKLDSGVVNNADEATINPLLKNFYQTLQRRHNIFTSQVKKIVNPCVQAKISILDSSVDLPEEDANGTDQGAQHAGHVDNVVESGWWADFVREASVTEKQEGQIHQLRSHYNATNQQLRARRHQLNKEIKDFYRDKFFSIGQLGGQPMKADVPSVIELTSKLEEMRKNLDTEKQLVLETHEALADVLTPKQEALFVTRAYTKAHTTSTDTLQMVAHVWASISRKEDALSRCCDPRWPLEP